MKIGIHIGGEKNESDGELKTGNWLKQRRDANIAHDES